MILPKIIFGSEPVDWVSNDVYDCRRFEMISEVQKFKIRFQNNIMNSISNI